MAIIWANSRVCQDLVCFFELITPTYSDFKRCRRKRFGFEHRTGRLMLVDEAGSMSCVCRAFLGLLLTLTAGAQALDFTYSNNNGGITITGYKGLGGAVAIPGTIDGLPVMRIGDWAFNGLASLASVTIPNTVTRIGLLAFNDCTNLTSIVIANSVTNIEDGISTVGGDLGAFSFCTSLTNITFGNAVTYIGLGAFRSCSNLTSIALPDSVNRIGESAFCFCTGLTNLTVPDSVTSIGDWAFLNCSNLASLRIGKSVTDIGLSAFGYCTSLTKVTIPDSVSNLANGSGSASWMPWGGAFSFCTSLTNVVVGNSVTNIGDYAFWGCTNLVSLYWRGNAPRQGVGVFSNANSATVYYLPGMAGWTSTFDGRPTALWNPLAQTSDATFGVRQNGFGFNIAGTPDIPMVIEASTDVTARSWVPLQSCTLTNGSIYFSDPQWTSYPSRVYRIRSP